MRSGRRHGSPDTDGGWRQRVTNREFIRELSELKTNANYSTCDPSSLSDWLGSIDPHFRQYTYNLVHCGIGKGTLSGVTEEQLVSDCRIENGIHRARIFTTGQGERQSIHQDNRVLESYSVKTGTLAQLVHADQHVPELLSNLPQSRVEPNDGSPDVFISYRRSTGSQLASLLKVHLQLRGLSVFIDVEKLEAGTFEDKLVQSVKRARNFLLVLSANALDKCMDDLELKDWVHKEIVLAMSCNKNIVPIIDQFSWPDPARLPEDMRDILKFNGVQWVHEYQDASIEKILRFLQAQNNVVLSERDMFS